jgi:Recombinase zinc beta ribbon domain
LQRTLSHHPHGPAREGAAVRQGIVLCGACGRHMTPSSTRHAGGRSDPISTCKHAKRNSRMPLCPSIPGGAVEAMISAVLLEQGPPLAMEAAWAVQPEMGKRAREAEKLWPRQVERAPYAADVARRRLMAVEPALRHVAQTLEAAWHDTLDHLQQAQHDSETRRANSHHVLNAQQPAEMRRLATAFPSIWSHPATSHHDKKRMARLLLEDVPLQRDG